MGIRDEGLEISSALFFALPNKQLNKKTSSEKCSACSIYHPKQYESQKVDQMKSYTSKEKIAIPETDPQPVVLELVRWPANPAEQSDLP